MTNNDPLAACLSMIDNADRVSKKAVSLEGSSSIILNVLSLLQKSGYIGEVNREENLRGGKLSIVLLHAINRCGAIKPRFKVKCGEIEKFEQRYLPAKSFGILIISTSSGLMINEEAKKKNLGGRLVAYCY